MRNDEVREGLLSIVEALPDLEGRFSDIRRMGTGGGGGMFSLMFSALDATTGKRTAIKVFNPMHRSNDYRFRSFQREIQLLESLQGQPDIVQLISPGSTITQILRSDTGIPYPVEFSFYAMELAQRSAKDRLADGGWPPLERLECFRSLCRALQRIHSREIAHRDLKPENVLQVSRRVWALSDFGTARSFTDGSTSLVPAYGMFIPGDKRYWAPEMIAGLHDVDPRVAKRSDIFSLGAILFELFAETPLGTQIYDAQFVEDLMKYMAPIPPSKRAEIYHQVIREIVDARPLPAIAAFDPDLPRCIRPYVEELYRSLASLDYRARPLSFEPVFRKLDISVRVLSNQLVYENYMAARFRRRSAMRPS